MGNNQKIKCTVCSCQFNSIEDCNCKLDEITVKPYPNEQSRKTDETVCSNYRCCK